MSGLLAASLVVSTALNQLVLARAPVVGEDVGDAADADALDLTTLRTRPIRQSVKKRRWRLNTSPLSARGLPQDKNPNECASKIDRIRMWKLAKKSTEDRFTKISKPMRVKD